MSALPPPPPSEPHEQPPSSESHEEPTDRRTGDAAEPIRSGGRDDARRAVEAVVLVSEQPVDVNLLGQLLELRPAIVEELCRELAAEYEAQGRGFQLARVAGGWRFQSHPDQAPYVERYVLDGQSAKLSNAALETLAIVAYKQPISRAQVASIRGVSVDGVMRTLQQRGYIAEIGRDPGPGQAAMFGTTRAFLERLGVDTLGDLPALGEFVPGADVVEQLERGLRPDSPTIPERLEQIEAVNAQGDLATTAPSRRPDEPDPGSTDLVGTDGRGDAVADPGHVTAEIDGAEIDGDDGE